jgi:integrase
MRQRSDGLALRKGKKKETWWLEFVHFGARHRVRIGSNINRTVARELAAVKRAAILKGEVGIGGGKKRKDLLFDTAVVEFLKWAEANRKPKTAKTYRTETKQLMKSFGGKKLGEIHPFLIEKHKQMRIQADAKVSANRELTCLKNIFNRCLEWKKFEGENPAESVKGTKEPKTRLRFLSYEEEARLLAQAQEPLRTIILVGIHLGLRIQAEALTLRWESVDLRRRQVTVEAAYAKNGETRTVPLNQVAWEALSRLKADSTSEMVFISQKGSAFRSIRTAFTTACRDAKLTGISPHVLRHTFGSRLAMAGVDLRTIQELGGWKDIKMVERYAHLSESHKAAAVERIAAPSPVVLDPTGVPTRIQAVSVSH